MKISYLMFEETRQALCGCRRRKFLLHHEAAVTAVRRLSVGNFLLDVLQKLLKSNIKSTTRRCCEYCLKWKTNQLTFVVDLEFKQNSTWN